MFGKQSQMGSIGYDRMILRCFFCVIIHEVSLYLRAEALIEVKGTTTVARQS